MNNQCYLVRRFIFNGVLLFIVSCGESRTQQTIPDYSKLCKIYEEIAPKSISPAIKGMDISERIKNELPIFYERDYQHIVFLTRKDRYKTVKEIVEKEPKMDWDCTVMKEYFSGKFDQETSEKQ